MPSPLGQRGEGGGGGGGGSGPLVAMIQPWKGDNSLIDSVRPDRNWINISYSLLVFSVCCCQFGTACISSDNGRFVGLFLGCLTSQQKDSAYLRDGSAQIMLRAATLR